MRIVVSEFMSLDGVVQAPGGPDEDTDGGFAHGGWSGRFFDPEVMGPAFDEAMTGTDALLFGRRTWQTMAAAWPERAGDPFADKMNAIPKYVVSKTLRDDELTWNNTTRIPGDEAIARIRTLRDTNGGNLLVMGSPTLVRALLREGLVDELRLDDRTGDPRWRQDDLSRRWGAAHARTGLHGHQRDGRARVHLPDSQRGVARLDGEAYRGRANPGPAAPHQPPRMMVASYVVAGGGGQSAARAGPRPALHGSIIAVRRVAEPVRQVVERSPGSWRGAACAATSTTRPP